MGSFERPSSVDKFEFLSAKSLKIGASGGAAQAAEAIGRASLNFTVVHLFASHFGNPTPQSDPYLEEIFQVSYFPRFPSELMDFKSSESP